MGPVERALRDDLGRGPLSRDEAKRRHGALGGFHFDRLLKIGALEGNERGARLRVWRPEPSKVEAWEAEKARRAEEQRRLAERAQAEAAARQERHRREEEQRRLFAGTEYLPLEERRLVVAERVAALAEAREGVED